MITVILIIVTACVTWFVAKIAMSKKRHEAETLCVITNERTGMQSLAKLAQSIYADQEYAIVAHNKSLVHLRKQDTIRFYTPSGEVINEANWVACKPPLQTFASLEDDKG